MSAIPILGAPPARQSNSEREDEPGSGDGSRHRPQRDRQALRSTGRRDPLERALGAPVKIHGKEKGRIEVRFSSLEELERLYEQLLSSTGGSI